MARKKRSSKLDGGRQRQWTIVSFDELDGWRSERGIPKKRMAEMVGVTNSTYHNWARGSAVATQNTQERIRAILDGRADVNGDGTQVVRGEVAAATGTIVAAYLGNRKRELSSEELSKLVREVRRALEG
ncbi:MAG: hypothetical protein AB7N76_17890 [Planctomycetota bacterium]